MSKASREKKRNAQRNQGLQPPKAARQKGSMDPEGLIEAAVKQGFALDYTAGRHPRLTPRDKTKRPCTFSGTPGDVKAVRNFLSCLRQSGLIYPPKED